MPLVAVAVLVLKRHVFDLEIAPENRTLYTSSVRSKGLHAAEKFAPSSWLKARPASQYKRYSSTYLAIGFANVRAGTWYPPEH